jgi:hypothetical protein
LLAFADDRPDEESVEGVDPPSSFVSELTRSLPRRIIDRVAEGRQAEFPPLRISYALQ